MYVTYAPAPGADDLAVLQPILDRLGAQNGGLLLLQAGAYHLAGTLEVPNKVTVRGVARSGTVVTATAPTAGPLIRLGPAAGLSFAARLERMSINAAGGDTAVYSAAGQEMTGLSYVTVSGFTGTGIHFDTGVANYDCDNIELYPAETGAATGFRGQGNQGANSLRRVTVGVSGPLRAGVHFEGGSFLAQSIHVENCADGVLVDGGNGAVIGVTGPTVNANVGNLVRMKGNSRYVVAQAITRNSATAAVRDEFFGRTITDDFVQSVVMGDTYTARLAHYGDRAGFFGATPTQKPTSLPAVNRATVDATYGAEEAAVLNNTRTRLAELETRLQKLGLLA